DGKRRDGGGGRSGALQRLDLQSAGIKLPLEPGQLRLAWDPAVALELEPHGAAACLLRRGAFKLPAEVAITVHIHGLHAALCGDLQIFKTHKAMFRICHHKHSFRLMSAVYRSYVSRLLEFCLRNVKNADAGGRQKRNRTAGSFSAPAWVSSKNQTGGTLYTQRPAPT